MIEVKITDLRRDIGKYIDAVEAEDILVLRGNKPVAMITLPDTKQMRIQMAKSLFGIIPASGTTDTIEETRLKHLEERHGKGDE